MGPVSRATGRCFAVLLALLAMGSTAGAAAAVYQRARAATIGLWSAAHGADPFARVLSGPLAGRLQAGGRGGLTGSPGSPPVANAKTGTLYVPIQSSNVVDVINSRKCNTSVASSCAVVATAAVGAGPLTAVLDPKTDTIYVANGGDHSGTISVLNGAKCNATVTSACAKQPATIDVGGFPVAEALDPATSTLYVADLSGNVFVIDTSRCSAITTTGCGESVKSIKDSRGPDAIDVDIATDTVYAANSGFGGDGNTVSVINGATCNGSTSGGCGQTPRTITVGSGPFWDQVDQATDTVYVANNNDGTVSVINGAVCNATVDTGCGQPFAAVPTGAGTGYLAVDDSRHTVFAINQGDDAISEINTRTCDGTVTSDCSSRPPNEQAAFNPPAGYNPNTFALVPETGTVYLVNGGGEDFLEASSIRRCNALDTSGCRVEAPNTPDSEFLMVQDPATNTIYAASLSLPQIDVLNGATCQPQHLSGCAPVSEIPIADPQANLGALDDATHTLYASDPFSGNVYVINTSACSAAVTSGCGAASPTIAIGPSLDPPAFNPVTRTLYVPFGDQDNRIAVLDAATCNAENATGCGQTPAIVTVGAGTAAIALSVKTDTVYAPSTGIPPFTGDTVFMINGATCNGTDHSGCSHAPATATVGVGPFGVAVDDATGTVYVANNADGDLPGTVSVINSATCNGAHTAGCAAPFPTVSVGRSPLLVAIDNKTNRVYVTDFSSAGVSVIDGSSCDAAVHRGCTRVARLRPVGSDPFGLAVSEGTNTVYASDLYGSGSLSVFAGAL